MEKSTNALIEELRNHLIGQFPMAQQEKAKNLAHIGLLIPNTESADHLKNCIRDFFMADGSSEAVDDEEISLGFKKGQTAVAINICDLHDVLRIFAVPANA